MLNTKYRGRPTINTSTFGVIDEMEVYIDVIDDTQGMEQICILFLVLKWEHTLNSMSLCDKVRGVEKRRCHWHHLVRRVWVTILPS